VISGRPEQFKVFRRGGTYKGFCKDGIKVTFAPTLTVATSVTSSKRTVRQILGDLVQESPPEVQRAYEKLVMDCK